MTPAMSSSAIETTLTSLSNEAQFSSNRYAVLFMPGSYEVQAPVGYYESIAGLGETPGGVTINGFLTPNFGVAVYGTSTWPGNSVLDTFWRSMENMTINAATDTGQNAAPNTLQWGVSQGAPLRRLQINGSLELTDSYCGQASGGFMSDTVVTGGVNPCSQQQWYTRNSSLGSWSGGVWNMVFSGVQGAPTPNYPTNPFTVLPTTPLSREKPFLFVDGAGKFRVFVPTVRANSSGVSWSHGAGPGYSLPIESFYIAQPTTTLTEINRALALGKNLILTPGLYQYSGAIRVTNPNTIVLGLGYADIIPQTGTAAITVADVDGVQIAGLLIDAGPVNSPVLLQIGSAQRERFSHWWNPTSVNDVFFRIGGAAVGSATTSLEVNSDDVILDNIWAWRADHGDAPVGWTVNVGQHGVVVNGDNVTALGLAVEHYEQNQVIWNGERGKTVFYQSELPYDVPSQAAWINGGVDGYSSYAVSSSVKKHEAYGLGVYSFFDQGVDIVETSAIAVPNAVGVTVTDAVSIFLSGDGSITSTVDDAGTTADAASYISYVPFYQGVPCGARCPATPRSLAAKTISATQINLTWTPSTTPGVVYSVFRGTSAGFSPSIENQLTSGVSGASYADTTVSPSSSYYYVVEAHNGLGFSPLSNYAIGITPASGGLISTDVIEINAGGAAAGSWLADEDFTGGTPSSTTAAINTSDVRNATAAPQAVYQTNRYGSFTYAIPGLTPGGSYTVDLHFAENYWTLPGQREFNVLIDGTQVLTNFDMVAAAGGQDIAVVQSFLASADSTGTITVQFAPGAADQPQINGIEIGLGGTPAPTAPAGLAASAIDCEQVRLKWKATSTSGAQYEVFRSTTPGFTPAPGNLITTTSAVSYVDNGLAPSTTYYYLVEANNTLQTSQPSNQASAGTSAFCFPVW